MFYKIFLLMRKEFVQFLRNVPLLIIVLYCATIDVYSAGEVTMDLNQYPIAIYDRDKSVQSRDILSRLRGPLFRVTHIIDDESKIKQLIEEGVVSVVVVVPSYFGKKISSYQMAPLQIILDGANSNASELALRNIQNIVSDYNIKLIFTKWEISNVAKDMIPYVDYQTRYPFNPNLIDRWAFCLQEFFMVITLVGLLLTATAIVNEKQFGTIEQLMVTPLTTLEIMISKIVPMIAVLMLTTFIAVFVILKPLIGIPFEGSILGFFFISLLYAFSITGLGLVIATISSNLSETVIFSILMLVPIMFLSGAWVPLESLPKFMQILVMLSPLKYYLDLGNGILLKGNSLSLMWKDILALLALGLAFFSFGALRFRKVFQ